MLIKQYFLVRPTIKGERRFQELGINSEEDAINPRIWSQTFDLRMSYDERARKWWMDVVILQYIAHVLTELEEVGVTALSKSSFDELLGLWTVEWIAGGLVDLDDVDFSVKVVHQLTADKEGKDPTVFAELKKHLAR